MANDRVYIWGISMMPEFAMVEMKETYKPSFRFAFYTVWSKSLFVTAAKFCTDDTTPCSCVYYGRNSLAHAHIWSTTNLCVRARWSIYLYFAVIHQVVLRCQYASALTYLTKYINIMQNYNTYSPRVHPDCYIWTRIFHEIYFWNVMQLWA